MASTRTATRTTSRPRKARSGKTGAVSRGGGANAQRRPWRHMPQVALLLGMLACVYSVVALASYDPRDPSFSQAGGDLVRNAAGPVGAWVSDVLLQVVGYGAWGVLVLGVLMGLKLAGRRLGGVAAGVAWVAAGWAVLSVLSLVMDPAGRSFPPGGLVGAASARALVDVIGPAGAWIALVGCLLAAAPFALGIDWGRVAARAVGGVEGALPVLGRAGLHVGRQAVGGVVTAGAAVASAGVAVAGAVRRPESGDDASEESDEWPDDERWSDASLPVAVGPSVAERPSVAAQEALPPIAPPPIIAPPVAAPPPMGVERPTRTATPTSVAHRALVEVEWDPTDLPERDTTVAPPSRPSLIERADLSEYDEPSVGERPSIASARPSFADDDEPEFSASHVDLREAPEPRVAPARAPRP